MAITAARHLDLGITYRICRAKPYQLFPRKSSILLFVIPSVVRRLFFLTSSKRVTRSQKCLTARERIAGIFLPCFPRQKRVPRSLSPPLSFIAPLFNFTGRGLSPRQSIRERERIAFWQFNWSLFSTSNGCARSALKTRGKLFGVNRIITGTKRTI